jgi:hypothetical protein
MKIHDSAEWLTVLNILDKIKIPHSEWAVAGGYARDLYFGLPPKDMDVGFFNIAGDDISYIKWALEKEGLLIMDYFDIDLEDEGAVICADYDGNGIKGVITVKGGIDLIFTEFENVQQWSDSFDYNINQFWIDGLDRTTYIGSESTFGVLTFLHSNTKRHEKLIERKAKFLKLTNEPKVAWAIDWKSIDLLNEEIKRGDTMEKPEPFDFFKL